MPFKTAYGVSDVEVAEFVEENEVVRAWCKKFMRARNEVWLSGSRLDKARILCRFFKWLRMEREIELSPEQLLNRQLQLRQSNSVKDRQWLLNLVLEHSRDNPDFSEYADMTKYGMFTCVKSFCAQHEVTLTTAKGVYGKKRRKKNHRKQISLADAKKILGRMSQRDRTICLIQLQSGMEIGAVLNKFNYMWDSQVEAQLDCDRMKIEFDERKANGSWYFTYISRDAIHELRKWIEMRRNLMGQDGNPIFVTRFKTPLKSNQFIKNFSKTVNGNVTTHMFRKLFHSEATVPDRGIDSRIVKFWMGHITDMDDEGGIYGRNVELREEIFEREYMKLEPYINIYSGVQVEPMSEEEREMIVLFREPKVREWLLDKMRGDGVKV